MAKVNYVIKKFPKEILKDLLCGDADYDYEVIEDKIYDTSRWSIHHELIFKYKDETYQVTYSVGATEQQDESPFEYEGDEIDCILVRPVEKVIIDYQPVRIEDA